MGFTPNQFIAHKSKKKKSSASSIYIGVSFIKPKNKWSARIKIKGTSITIGTFHSEIEAARAYNMVAVSAYGDEANINDLTRR